MKKHRARADVLLVEQGLVPTRAKAQALILAGSVYVGDQRIDKAGTQLPSSASLRLTTPARFVSRGGYKLEGALDALGVHPAGKVCLDVGASTGGFTDCLLQRGAARVFAVDVGHGLLADKLRTDERVVVMDRTNARSLRPDQFDVPLDCIVVDASFIGMGKLVGALATLLSSGKELLAMIKPQFEVGRKEARIHQGVVRDPALRNQAIERAKEEIAQAGFSIRGQCDSLLPGPKGNVECFVYAERC